MTFEDSSFDVIVDKATMDAMLYGDLWDPSDEVKENVGKYIDGVSPFYLFPVRHLSEEEKLSENFRPESFLSNLIPNISQVSRILRPGGIFLYITWRQPHFIRPLLQRPEIWDVSVETLAELPGGGGMFEYFGWVAKKRT